MLSFIRMRLVVLLNFFFFLPSFVWGVEIRICLWEGKEPQKVLKNFEKKYRGALYIQKYNDNYLIINKIDLEEYLYGVVGKEMEKDWPFESLKAQSVCSRTIALKKKYENEEKKVPFDITSSVFHQVYGSCEEDRVIKAVEETREEILSYNDEVVPVFFHACCGGKTSAASEVWGGENILWLASVDDPYCKFSPYSSWKRTFSKSELARVLDTGSIKEIRIEEEGPSGRVKNLRILLQNSEIISFSGHRFRMGVNSKATSLVFGNSSTIPSTFFSVENTKNEVIFSGQGYGHGVGMCQWGAKVMAEKGSDYREILSHYFPLLGIKKISEVSK